MRAGAAACNIFLKFIRIIMGNTDKSPVAETAKEYARGIIGGLLFSLPLLYTMEVWWTGFIASPVKLAAFVLFTFLLLIGYNKHAGVRKDISIPDLLRESVEEIGLAFIITFLFLLLINKVGFTMSFREIAGKVIVESMVVAIGISVGTTQLGEGDKVNGESSKKKKNTMTQMLVLAVCGAVLVSSSVAPTEEILIIAIASTPIHLLFMVLVSLILCALIVGYIDFVNTSIQKESDLQQTLSLMVVSYVAALLVSFIMLWFFGRINDKSLEIVIAQTIVLAIPATLGASAGRLIIGK